MEKKKFLENPRITPLQTKLDVSPCQSTLPQRLAVLTSCQVLDYSFTDRNTQFQDIRKEQEEFAA